MHRLPITIVIPTYNDAHYLTKCLSSIRKQTLLPENVLIIDDGSDNDLAYTISCNEDDELLNIQYIKIKNSGPSGARNKGLKLVSTQYVLFMDVDDLLEKRALEVLFLKLEEKGKDYFGVCGRIKNKKGILTERTKFISEKQINFQDIGRKYALQGQISSYLLNTEYVKLAGGFNKSLSHYEDFHLILSLSKNKKLSSVDFFCLRKINRKDSQSNKNFTKSFLGALKFLSKSSEENLLEAVEIRLRKKEAYLSYAKSLFKSFKLIRTRIALEHAFLFSPAIRRKEVVGYYFLKLLKSIDNRKQKANHGQSISIIIPTFNDESFLYESIDSILSQSLLPNEIIVVDDGSYESYLDRVEKYVSARNSYVSIRTARINNSGPSRARNVGASIAQSRYLLFLDSDDMLDRDALINIRKALSLNANKSILHGGIKFTSNKLKVYLPKSYFTLNDRDLIGKNKILEGLSSFIFSKDRFLDLGGFDENLSHNEDFDLVLRYLKNNLDIATLYFEIPIIRKRKGSLSNVNAEKAFNGVNKFLDKAERNDLLSKDEIKTRRKESLLTLAKHNFYELDLKSFTRNVDKAFEIGNPEDLKQMLVNSYLKLIKISGFKFKN